eukprot:Skav224959  [mRNA]  locus=scaffold1186:442732:443157:+ [translate_table: standard]
MSGFGDRHRFLWSHCQRAPNGEIAVLGTGDTAMDHSPVEGRAMGGGTSTLMTNYFDVKVGINVDASLPTARPSTGMAHDSTVSDKDLQAILTEQDEKAQTLKRLCSELLQQSEKVEQEARNLQTRSLEDRFLCIILSGEKH